ncbi:hypothetical protein XBI1_3080050 [Xenorhabdus bovienii str. Intermedium]|uniref:Uncharacterized protein n=1 Tax=Xenorhabdus bovienii str. Intermedium TaxID=1379677 RepID=A0A077QPT1_XENBV|nr:hypothetical protein XBI1_3080050 [Xenorhabdus bovienii str. Intermedium]
MFKYYFTHILIQVHYYKNLEFEVCKSNEALFDFRMNEHICFYLMFYIISE